MKKFVYLAMALGLVACQAENPDAGGNGSGDVETNYVSINIVSADDGLLSRANEYDQNDSYEKGNPGYESKVSTILFYFFDANGDAVVVDYAKGNSFKLFEVPADGFAPTPQDPTTNNSTVEQIHEATIILQTKKVGEDYVGVPAKTLVVVNPGYTETHNLSLSQVLAKINTNFNSLTNQTNGFTMSNSTYVDESGGEVVNAVSLAGHIETSEVDAKSNPVEIYVERVVAKINVSIATVSESSTPNLRPVTGGAGSYTTNVFDTGVTYGDEPIYVHLEGWNATATADQSHYVKSINKSWPNNTDATNLFKTANQPWNWDKFHRSFWAINPDEVDYKYGNFSGGTVEGTASAGLENANPANKYATWDGSTYIYIPENAAEDEGVAPSWEAAKTANPTKIIISAKLIDKTGSLLELAQFGGQTFVSTAASDYETVKSAILGVAKTYYKEVTSPEHKFVSIAPDDVEIKTAWESGVANGSKEGRYRVYAVLKGTTTVWYDDMPDDETIAAPETLAAWKEQHVVSNNNVVAKALLDAGGAKVWKSGATYYYYDIRHLSNVADAPGYFGVVRNHIYRTTITGITGLGTPVFNPNEIIIPEKPSDEFGYIAAKINVLGWRIVNHGYDLDWE